MAARALLDGAGLGRFYDLRGARGAVGEPRRLGPEPWVEEACARLAASQDPIAHLDVDIQGLRCAACVWVVEQLFRRLPGALDVDVNPAAGTLSLRIVPGEFPLAAWVSDLGAVGYRVGPHAKREAASASRALLVRVGICAAIALQVMMMSLAIYGGLDDGLLFVVMRRASLIMTGIAVFVGGMPFFESALAAARRRTLHLDLPISFGIVLAYGGSVASELLDRGRASYFDTVAVFVTLMLVGRFLQERVLERNRRDLLADDGVGNLTCRVLAAGRIERLRVADVPVAASLLVRPGELVPLDGTLEEGEASIRRDWLTGESRVMHVAAGETISGGSFLASETAVLVRVTQAFADSRLASLLRPPSRDRATDVARRTALWARIARAYVVGTLTIAALTGTGWMLFDRTRALSAVVAVLVVACPCAFGIAVPIAYELVQARLRRHGVFVRSSSLLERLARVTKIVFDKTGTLTLGTLEIVDTAALAALSPEDRDALYAMVVRSNHPKSVAVERWLSPRGARDLPSARVAELPGRGLSLFHAGRAYRFGSVEWAGGDAHEPGDVAFTRDGVPLAALATRERFAPDTAAQLEQLTAQGYEIHLLSGDDLPRVREAAERLGIAAPRARGGASPEEKHDYVAALDRDDTLMIGDGVNDACAMDAAFACVTPAGELLPARTDAFVEGPVAAAIARLLHESQRLDRVVQRTVFAGALYNVVAVAAAALGQMSPLLAAVLMPASSIAVVTYAVLALRGGDARSAPSIRNTSPLPPVPPLGAPSWKSSSSSVS